MIYIAYIFHIIHFEIVLALIHKIGRMRLNFGLWKP